MCSLVLGHGTFFVPTPMTFASTIFAFGFGFQLLELLASVLDRQIRRTDWVLAFAFAFAFLSFA
jgi:hypothetical protein